MYESKQKPCSMQNIKETRMDAGEKGSGYKPA